MQKGSSLREGGSPEVLWQWVAERAKRLCGLLGETWESSRTRGLQAPCRRNLPRSGGAQSLYLYKYQNNFLGAEIIWLGTCVFKKPDSFVSQKITFWFTWWRGKLSTDVNHWLVPAILRSGGKTCSVPINNQWQNVKSPCTTFSSNVSFLLSLKWRSCHNSYAHVWGKRARAFECVAFWFKGVFISVRFLCWYRQKFQKCILLSVTHNPWDGISNQLNCFTSVSMCLVLKHNLLKAAYWNRQPRCCCLFRNKLCSSKVYRCSGTWALNWKVAFSFF